MDTSGIAVLLIDDDEEEYMVVRRYLEKARGAPFDVAWVATFEDALETMERGAHDVCLLDYRLGERTGIELLERMRQRGLETPVILLTGRGSLELDLEAMELGAFDYLDKAELTPILLERSIRYALENYRARAALRKANEELESRV